MPKKPQPGKPENPRLCAIDECEKTVVALGMCKQHYDLALKIEKRMQKYGTLTPIGKDGRPVPGLGTGGARLGSAPLLTADEATIKRIRDLAGLQCTKFEIAGVLQVSKECLYDFFVKYPEVEAAFEDGRLNGKASLRRTQFVMAKRSAAMGIHLGRQYLDQFDKRPAPLDSGFLTTGDPASEEAPSALLRAVRAEIE